MCARLYICHSLSEGTTCRKRSQTLPFQHYGQACVDTARPQIIPKMSELLWVALPIRPDGPRLNEDLVLTNDRNSGAMSELQSLVYLTGNVKANVLWKATYGQCGAYLWPGPIAECPLPHRLEHL